MPAARPSFPATVSGYEPYVGIASNGDDYVCLRGATIQTAYETIDGRTVMAFGPPAAALARRLAETGDAPLALDLFHAGAILKVAGEDAAVEARRTALARMTLIDDTAAQAA